MPDAHNRDRRTPLISEVPHYQALDDALHGVSHKVVDPLADGILA